MSTHTHQIAASKMLRFTTPDVMKWKMLRVEKKTNASWLLSDVAARFNLDTAWIQQTHSGDLIVYFTFTLKQGFPFTVEK